MAKTKKIKAVKQETPAQRLSGIIKSCRQIMRKDKGMNGDADRLPMLTWIMFLKFLDDNEQMQEVNAQLEGKKYKPAIESPYRWRDWAKDTNLTGDDLLNFISNEKVTLSDGKERTGLFYYLRSLQSESGTERKDVIATAFKGISNRMINGYLLRDVVNKIDGIHFTNNEEINTLSHLYESILKEMRDASGDAGEFYTPRPVVRFMVEMLDPKIGETVLDPASGTGGFLVEAFEHLKKQVQTIEHKITLQKDSILGGEAKALPYLLCQMNLLLHGLNYPKIDSGNSLRTPLREIGDNQRVDVILTNPPFGGEEEKGILNNFPDDRRTTETAILFIQLILRKLKRNLGDSVGGRAAIVVPNTTLFYGNITKKIREDLLIKHNLHTVVRLPKGVFEPYTDIETNLLFFDNNTPTEEVFFFEVDLPDGKKQFTKTFPMTYEHISQYYSIIKERDTNYPLAWKVLKADILKDPNINLDLKNPKNEIIYLDNPLEQFNKVKESLDKSMDRISKVKEIIDNNILRTNDFEWGEFEIGELLDRNKTQITLDEDETYKRIRIQVKGRGIVLRDQEVGHKIGTKKQFIVNEGQFVLSKIDARYGAFGIIPEDCDGAIITGNFWAYDINEDLVYPKLLQLITRSQAFIDACSNASTGATNRKYLDENIFLRKKISIPRNIEIQKVISASLEELYKHVSISEKSLQSDLETLPTLFQSSLIHLFGRTFE